MWVESTEGCGSSFYFTIAYIPIATEDMRVFEEDENTQIEGDKNFTGKNVLLVEPVETKFSYYEKLISKSGANSIRANDLQQCYDIFLKTARIDVALIDGTLFDTEDFNNLQRIRRARTALPLVLIVPDREKYMHHVEQNICSMIVEFPVTFSKIIEIMETTVNS